MFDRRLIENLDWGLLLITFLIAGLGLVVLFSAVNAGDPGGGGVQGMHILFKKQMIWVSGSFLIMTLSLFVPYRMFDKGSILIYLSCIALLAAVLLFGKDVGGSRRWLALGPFTVQPSELMKISLIVVLASTFSGMVTENGLSFNNLLKPGLLMILPFVLILVQPDLGTALLLLFITASMTIFVKVEKKVFFTCLTVGLSLIPLAWQFLLKEYQKGRVLTFLDPDRDPLGAGYHIIQSKIAIGSGGLYGKGWLNGTQSHLEFLPERHTDFIFAVFSEEFGLLGAGLLLMLYLFIIIRGLYMSTQAQGSFSRLLGASITLTFLVYIFVNIGMVTGILPVVGVPLPLVSYGGTSLITLMAGFGLLMSVYTHRRMLAR